MRSNHERFNTIIATVVNEILGAVNDCDCHAWDGDFVDSCVVT